MTLFLSKRIEKKFYFVKGPCQNFFSREVSSINGMNCPESEGFANHHLEIIFGSKIVGCFHYWFFLMEQSIATKSQESHTDERKRIDIPTLQVRINSFAVRSPIIFKYFFSFQEISTWKQETSKGKNFFKPKGLLNVQSTESSASNQTPTNDLSLKSTANEPKPLQQSSSTSGLVSPYFSKPPNAVSTYSTLNNSTKSSVPKNIDSNQTSTKTANSNLSSGTPLTSLVPLTNDPPTSIQPVNSPNTNSMVLDNPACPPIFTQPPIDSITKLDSVKLLVNPLQVTSHTSNI